VVARLRQLERGGVNASSAPPGIEEFAHPNSSSDLLKRARTGWGLREEDTLRVARTIADLRGKELIELVHLAEAIYYAKPLEQKW
jgi:predicted ATPase with chaperone activity